MKHRANILLGWLAIQIVTLVLGAMRIPLAARSGNAPQHLGLPEMIVVQLGVATMLLPLLTETGTAAAVAITAIPFLQLAGFVTFTPGLPVMAVCVAMLLWIGGLRLWAAAIASPQSRMNAVAVLNSIVIGGPLLVYLIREFTDLPGEAAFSLPAIIDPLNCILRQSAASNWSPSCLAAPAALLASGVIAIALQRSAISAKLPT